MYTNGNDHNISNNSNDSMISRNNNNDNNNNNHNDNTNADANASNSTCNLNSNNHTSNNDDNDRLPGLPRGRAHAGHDLHRQLPGRPGQIYYDIILYNHDTM